MPRLIGIGLVGEAMMREALAQLRLRATTAHRNYTGAIATNLAMWS